MSQRKSDSISEPDRQLKKLFRAIQDNDINYVCSLLSFQCITVNYCASLVNYYVSHLSKLLCIVSKLLYHMTVNIIVSYCVSL